MTLPGAARRQESSQTGGQLGSGLRIRDWQRGATVIFFLGGMMPMIFLAMMLAVDLTRIVDAQRQAAYVAENAAIAGALQYQNDSARLNSTRAADAARETGVRARDAGVMKHATDISVSGISLARRSGADTVTVTISYRIEKLIVAQYFIGQDNRVMAATRTAEVCVPDTSASRSATRGFCSRPRASGG